LFNAVNGELDRRTWRRCISDPLEKRRRRHDFFGKRGRAGYPRSCFRTSAAALQSFETPANALKHAKKPGRTVPSTSRPRARPRKQHIRLAAGERREQLLEAAALSIVEQGFLPLPLERLARRAKVSKALVYAYFPTQHDIFNALLKREIELLFAAGLDEASRAGKLEAAAVACAMIYFEHVATRGPLLHILLSDRYMSGRLDRNVLNARDVVVRRLARLARTSLKLPARELVAAVNMVVAIPEEAGTLLFTQEANPVLVRDMCRTLVSSAITGLRSAARKS
jgi:AcrR family transcriptional regulator